MSEKTLEDEMGQRLSHPTSGRLLNQKPVHDPPVQTVEPNNVTLALDALLNEVAVDVYGNPDAVLDSKYAHYTNTLILAATQAGRAEAQQEMAKCEHCDLPLVCASAQAERIHGLELMHAETLTRAEAAEAEITRLSSLLAQREKEIAVDNQLLKERDRLLAAIPECPTHGPCVPHALAWIKLGSVALAQREAAQGWQDISTAPKDGTPVWAWSDARGANPAVWLQEAEAWVITYDDATIKPTHWQPLPPAPQEPTA